MGGQNIVDMIGRVFGRLTVLSRAPSNKHGNARWECECACGQRTIVTGNALRRNGTFSCGCLLNEVRKTVNITHGRYRTPEYKAWVALKQRCLNPKSAGYADYGGRGITVDQRWIDSFENFLSDMGERPTKRHSIDRRDNDGGYYKENCRWVELVVQLNNNRHNVFVSYRGERLTVAEAYKKFGAAVSYEAVSARIRKGWDVDAAFTTPKLKHRHHSHRINQPRARIRGTRVARNFMRAA